MSRHSLVQLASILATDLENYPSSTSVKTITGILYKHDDIEIEKNNQAVENNEEENTLDDDVDNVNVDQTPVEKNPIRYFKLIDSTNEQQYGRFTGRTPEQEAGKAFTYMLRKKQADGDTIEGEIQINVKESTRGCNRKVYSFLAKREKLAEPQKEVTHGVNGEEKTIEYHYCNRIEKIDN